MSLRDPGEEWEGAEGAKRKGKIMWKDGRRLLYSGVCYCYKANNAKKEEPFMASSTAVQKKDTLR